MSRVILPRWTRPNKQYLDETFPSGKPSFDQFPTVTELTYAYHCPLAIYHHLHHSEDGAFTRWGTPGGWKAGDTFHKFIERLKTMVIERKISFGDTRPQDKLGHIWSEFRNFGKRLDKPDIIWQEYLKPWIDRKLYELNEISPQTQTYFEITAAWNRVRFETEDGGFRTYPLIGRIDEIDLDRKIIIERTIKSAVSPKDYQLWLLWKVLCSIEKTKYPNKWKNVDFRKFELIVETPHNDFTVEKNNPSFERATHDCYAWIHDLTFDPKTIWDAYEERACTYEDRKTDCGLSWMCYAHKQRFPASRAEMRRQFKKLYRSLLWEKMWTSDFYQYKFATFSEEELNERRLLCKGSVIPQSKKGKTFQVKIHSSQSGPIRVKGSHYENRFLVVLGNLTIGRRYNAILKMENENIFSVTPAQTGWGFPFTDETIIATVGTDFFVFEEHPTHLITRLQQDMHRLEFRGTKSQTKAENDSKIQLLECVFGTRNIKRGRS